MCRSIIHKSDKYPFANALIAVLLATSVLHSEFPCYAEAPRPEARFRSTHPRENYRHSEKNKQEDRDDAEDSETIVEFTLSFSDSVELTVLESTAQTIGGDEPLLLALEPLTWDYTRWTIQLDRSIALKGWIELIGVNGQVFVVAAAWSDMLQDGRNRADRRLHEVISVEGEAELIDVLPVYADQDVTVSAFVGVDGLAQFPKPFRNPAVNSLLDNIDHDEPLGDSVQLVVLHPIGSLSAAPEKAESDTTPVAASAACCTLGGMCVVYGGDGCPDGTAPVACPCWSGE